MPASIRKISVITIFVIFLTSQAIAQPRKGDYINASIGLGISGASEDVDIVGSGFYLQGEYAYGMTKWFGLRPYAGLILTSAEENSSRPDLSEYKVTSNALLLGGKARAAIPIPFVAPFVELGIGISLGSFVTYTPNTNINKSGLLAHVPVGFGLALGRNHNVELAFFTYLHLSAEQYSGASAIGLSFPLNQ